MAVRDAVIEKGHSYYTCNDVAAPIRRPSD